MTLALRTAVTGSLLAAGAALVARGGLTLDIGIGRRIRPLGPIALDIAAPPEVVFDYFTDPTRMVDWFGSAALLDPRPGGAFRVEVDGRNVVVGEYVEVDSPRRVVFTWGFEGQDRATPPGSTRVEVTLEARGEGTLLVLNHHGLLPEARSGHEQGWNHFLGELVAVLNRN